MTTKPFEAGKYLTDLNGRDYLEVKWRLLWLRTEHPDAVIETKLMKLETGLALFRARVTIPSAGVASGWGSETADDFEDYIEKAETKALGRALAALGFGTQFCEDFDFSAEHRNAGEHRDTPQRPDRRHRVVDAPVAASSLKVAREGDSGRATSSQLNAINAIARAHEVGESTLEEHCRAAFGCAPSELSKRNASLFIDLLRTPANEAAAAPAAV